MLRHQCPPRYKRGWQTVKSVWAETPEIERPGFKVYRFKKGAWPEMILRAVMRAARDSEAEKGHLVGEEVSNGSLRIRANGHDADAAPQLTAIKMMFVLYALLGLIGGYIYSRIPPHPAPTKTGPPAALGPSRRIVYRLAALFCIDSFAGGFVVQSLLALWLFERFDMSLSAASLFFFWSGVLAAFSFPVAAWLSRRIGLVNTMVFTHIPSSLCLILAAFSANLSLTLALLLIRAALSQMDVPTRSS